MKINNQKGFVVQGAIVIIALLLISGGAYYAVKNQDTTPDKDNLNANQNIKDVTLIKEVTIMVPDNMESYLTAMNKYIFDGGNNPSKTWTFVAKKIPTTPSSDIIKTSAQVAAEQIDTQGGIPSAEVVYLKIVNKTAYILLAMQIDSWVSVSTSLAKIKPLVEKTLLQFPEIESVVFDTAPGDKIEDIEKSYKRKSVLPITILSPNGGENFVVDGGDINASIPVNFTLNKPQGFSVYLIDSKQNITASWATDNRFNSDLKINYKFNVNSLISGEKNSSPTKAGEYKIKICDYDGNNCDTSDNYFTIIDNRKSSIRVLSPNGGEKLLIGNKYEVKWSTSNNSDFVRLFLMPGNIPITSMANATAEFSSPFSWTINTNILPGQYKVEARLYTPYGDVPSQISFDQSDDYFTVIASK